MDGFRRALLAAFASRTAVSLAAFASLAALPAPAAGQDVSARAFVTPGTIVQVGAPFVLNVEVSGTQSVDQSPRPPDLGAAADLLSTGSQTSMQVVNARTTVSVTYQFRYQAIEEGTLEIPAVQVAAAGQTLATEPLSLTVSASAPSSGGPAGGGGGAPGLGNNLLVTAEASKARVIEGEPLVVEYRIWTRLDVSGYNLTRVPEPRGFWVEDVTPEGQPQVEQRTRNGQTYTTAVIRRVVLVPTGAGTRTVEPVGLEAEVRVRGRDPFDRFFRSGFGSTESTTLLSNELTIEVDPLPPGRPEPFSGVVGSLSLSAALDRDSVAVNEAATLTVIASGAGNVPGVQPPALDLPTDFEVFPPEVSESVEPTASGLEGSRTFEYVIIPRAPGDRAIPPIELGYFDPAAGEYRLASTPRVPLLVSGVGDEGPAVITRGGIPALREDIRFIHLGDPGLRQRERPLFETAGFWALALLPLIAVAGAVGARRRRDLLEGDVAYARGRRAGRVARKRLAEARRLAEGDDTRAFYAEVARALRGMVADRVNAAEAGLRLADVERLVAAAGVDESTVAELRGCLEHCDRQRFAPPGIDPAERARFLDRAARLMTGLDRGLR